MSQSFEETVNTYSQQFSSILDDFKKAYVLHNMSPDNNEYQNNYNNKKGQLDSIFSKLFVTTNNIQTEIEKLNKEIGIIDKKIQSEKAMNQKLTKGMSQIITSDNGSSKLIDETTDMYKIQYISNIMIIVGIFLLLTMMFVIFKKPAEAVAENNE